MKFSVVVGEEYFFSVETTPKKCSFDTKIVLWVGDALNNKKKGSNLLYIN